jgi:hypothetical protein
VFGAVDVFEPFVDVGQTDPGAFAEAADQHLCEGGARYPRPVVADDDVDGGAVTAGGYADRPPRFLGQQAVFDGVFDERLEGEGGDEDVGVSSSWF